MKPKIFITGLRGFWCTKFTIGVQTFTVHEAETKKEALWYCKQLRVAFKNMSQSTTPKTK